MGSFYIEGGPYILIKQLSDLAVHKDNYHEIREVIAQDPYAQFLGMKLTEFGPGTAEAELVVTENMVNIHKTVHGAVLFSLADYVFGAASNSYGKTAVGVTTSMNYLSAGLVGEKVTAVASEVKRTHKLAWYKIDVRNEKELLATMEAMVYRKSQYFVNTGSE